MAILGNVVVAAANAYIGRWTYVFGGTPDPPQVLEGDCSSFVTMILGYRLRLAVPGGHWGDPGMPPRAHGPVVSDYIAWNGAVTVGAPQAGDLVCYGPNEHIGFAIDADTFVSALNPSLGVRVEPIRGGAPGDITYRRVTGVAGIGLPGPVGQATGGTSGRAAAPIIAVLTFAATALGVFGIAVLGAAVLVPFLVRKVVSR